MSSNKVGNDTFGNKTTDLLKSLFFILYFVILTAERVISLVALIPFMALSLGELIDGVYVIVSLLAGWAYLFIKGRSIFKLNSPKSGSDFLQPSVAAGLLLFSGMLHTRGTIAPIQFVSYGFLLAAMGIYTAECVKAKGERALRWSTFAYITAFSMSIPVMYKTDCDCNFCIAFSITQIFVSLALVVCFTVMLYKFFENDSISSFCTYVIVFAAIGDGLVLFLRWHTEINFFVLGAVIAAIICFIVGKIFLIKYKAKEPVINDKK